MVDTIGSTGAANGSVTFAGCRQTRTSAFNGAT
jgi:hypothetical protein